MYSFSIITIKYKFWKTKSSKCDHIYRCSHRWQHCRWWLFLEWKGKLKNHGNHKQVSEIQKSRFSDRISLIYSIFQPLRLWNLKERSNRHKAQGCFFLGRVSFRFYKSFSVHPSCTRYPGFKIEKWTESWNLFHTHTQTHMYIYIYI